MNFKTVENKYRPIPFWSWNEKLDTEETARQIRLMGEAGIGGFFMHARGGLQTKYMGDDWHDNIRASINTAKERDMHPWVYDEDGWPSGFGGGIVSGMGEEYQLKYLRIEATAPAIPRSRTWAVIIFITRSIPFTSIPWTQRSSSSLSIASISPTWTNTGKRSKAFLPTSPRFLAIQCLGALYCPMLISSVTACVWKNICTSFSIPWEIMRIPVSTFGS